MNEDSVGSRTRPRGSVEKSLPEAQYSVKDFQLEVLGKLDEMQSLALGREEFWSNKFQGVREQQLLKFDSRTLIAMGAVALSVAGYVIQDARNSARQESEIQMTQARVVNLEQLAATNTEARIRTEAQLGQLREGMAEIKVLLETQEEASKKTAPRK